MKTKKWGAFKVSVYCLLAVSVFLAVLFVFAYFQDFKGSSLEDGLIFGGLLLVTLFMTWFQLQNIKMLHSFSSGNEATQKVLNWQLFLVIVNIIILAGVLIVTCVYIVPDMSSQWKERRVNERYVWTSVCWYLFNIVFIYNIITSLLFRKYLVYTMDKSNETLIESIGK